MRTTPLKNKRSLPQHLAYCFAMKPLKMVMSQSWSQFSGFVTTNKSILLFPNARNMDTFEIEMNRFGTVIINFALQNVEIQ